VSQKAPVPCAMTNPMTGRMTSVPICWADRASLAQLRGDDGQLQRDERRERAEPEHDEERPGRHHQAKYSGCSERRNGGEVKREAHGGQPNSRQERGQHLGQQNLERRHRRCQQWFERV